MSRFLQKFREFLVEHFTDYMFAFLGGPRLFPARYLANFFKGNSWIFVVVLMNYYENFSLRAYLYLILRGSYGFLWVFKDLVFPDQNFLNKMTIASTIGGLFVLSLYCSIDVLAISRFHAEEISAKRVCFLVVLYTFGVTFMLLADCQKYFSKKYARNSTKSVGNSRKNGKSVGKSRENGKSVENVETPSDCLIEDGFFKRNRNPNYFGEILIYASFAGVAQSWLAWVPLGIVWSTVFNLNIFLKDANSLSKKPGWEEYSKRSGRILFKLRENTWENLAIYAGIATIVAVLAEVWE